MIDRKLLKKISNLSKINLDYDREKSILYDLNQIIKWVDKFNDLDVKKIKPLFTMSFKINSLREDFFIQSLSYDNCFFNSNNHINYYFIIFKIKD